MVTVLVAEAMRLRLFQDVENYHSHPNKPYTLRQYMDRFTDANFKQETRFTKAQLLELVVRLRLPTTVAVRGTSQIEGSLAFTMMLTRLAQAAPVKGQMEHKYGWDKTYIYKWTNWAMNWLVSSWGHLLEIDIPTVAKKAPDWALAVGRKFGYRNPASNRYIFAMDGVFVPIPRPLNFQELCYNGQKGKHGLKYQAIQSPDGIVRDCYGPEPGAHHDIFLWRRSRVGPLLDLLPRHPEGEPYFIFGDSAYKGEKVAAVVVGGDRRFRLTREMSNFNQRMNRARVTVEWQFGRIFALWKGVHYFMKLKSGQSPVAQYYLCATLLTNFLTCLDGGNQTSAYFDCPPPTLQEYLLPPKPGYTRLEWMADEAESKLGLR
jgi:hypothetical protein